MYLACGLEETITLRLLDPEGDWPGPGLMPLFRVLATTVAHLFVCDLLFRGPSASKDLKQDCWSSRTGFRASMVAGDALRWTPKSAEEPASHPTTQNGVY